MQCPKLAQDTTVPAVPAFCMPYPDMMVSGALYFGLFTDPFCLSASHFCKI
ncbi:Uncharacterized protein dnm_030660 [Desulfonema magnum]|uniref:Uncharacterized protein n=1 Tax=Desulfonema magnum TaxID=45655 RepID=A0A975BL16_9BACT|nr:Uncharacterized protein dnm_030660 [Desulfonema magnum]